MIEIIFYCFGALLLASASMVVLLRNPIHAVLFLIFAFFNAAALLVLIGAEYFAMLLIIVYVGAVAVLFLFLVMMVEIESADLRQKVMSALPLSLILLSIVSFEMYVAMNQSIEYLAVDIHKIEIPSKLTDIANIGSRLYTEYVLEFQVAGLILLVAMIGVILLTMKHGQNVKRQNICNQVYRTREKSIALLDTPFNRGVELK